MTLPRLQISKILVKVYYAIENKSIEHVRYNDILICIDGISNTVYSSCYPDFLLGNLFLIKQIDELTYRFNTTVVYNQLVGKLVSSDSSIYYLVNRYDSIEDRLTHYVDFVINN